MQYYFLFKIPFTNLALIFFFYQKLAFSKWFEDFFAFIFYQEIDIVKMLLWQTLYSLMCQKVYDSFSGLCFRISEVDLYFLSSIVHLLFSENAVISVVVINDDVFD